MKKLEIKNIIKYMVFGGCLLSSGYLLGSDILGDANANGEVIGVGAETQNDLGQLYAAVRQGNLEVLRQLLEFDTARDVCNENICALLRAAINGGCLEVVELLLTFCVDMDAVNGDLAALLRLAVRHGNYGIVRLLLSHGINVDTRDRYGRTPLHWAVRLGSLRIVELLVEYGADMDVADVRRWRPLHFAVCDGGFRIAKLLLRNGVRVNAKEGITGYTPLHLAVQLGDLKLVRLLLRSGADVNAVNQDGQTAEDIAEVNGDVELANYLYEVRVRVGPAGDSQPELSPEDVIAAKKRRETANFALLDAAEREGFPALPTETDERMGFGFRAEGDAQRPELGDEPELEGRSGGVELRVWPWVRSRVWLDEVTWLEEYMGVDVVGV
jgi:ankyrin repeat protein